MGLHYDPMYGPMNPWLEDRHAYSPRRREADYFAARATGPIAPAPVRHGPDMDPVEDIFGNVIPFHCFYPIQKEINQTVFRAQQGHQDLVEDDPWPLRTESSQWDSPTLDEVLEDEFLESEQLDLYWGPMP